LSCSRLDGGDRVSEKNKTQGKKRETTRRKQAKQKKHNNNNRKNDENKKEQEKVCLFLLFGFVLVCFLFCFVLFVEIRSGKKKKSRKADGEK
jgi:ATP-dependent Zn protease